MTHVLYGGVSRLGKSLFGTAELRRPAWLGQQDRSRRVAERDRRDERDAPNEVKTPICPRRAFLACLAHHAPRSVALAACFSLLLGSGRRRQLHFDTRVIFIDVFVEMGFDDAVVVDAEALTEGILCDLEPAINVAS